MRFSFWPSTTQPWDSLIEPCRHVEATGWDGIWLADHFMPFAGDLEQPMLEVWSALVAVGSQVPRVRLGTLVCGNTYRHPAVLANQAATADVVTGGDRVVLGIGAGWQENEHRAYGIELPPPGPRLDRFDEACQIIRSLLHEPRTSFSGRYYEIDDAPLEPATGGQRPLPLMVGGGGEKRTMRIAARWADEWNVWADPELMAHKLAVLDRHCEELGRDPSEVQRSAVALLFLSDDESWLADIRSRDIERPHLVGTPAELVEQVGAFAEMGVDELIVPDFTLGSGSRRIETLDAFWTEVAPSFR